VVSTAENLFKDMTENDSTYRDLLLHLAAEAHTVIRLTAIAAEKEPHSTLCALIIKKNYAIWPTPATAGCISSVVGGCCTGPPTTPTPSNCGKRAATRRPTSPRPLQEHPR